LPCEDVADRVTELERGHAVTRLLAWVTGAAVVLLILALRRKGILGTDLFHEAFPPAGGAGA